MDLQKSTVLLYISLMAACMKTEGGGSEQPNTAQPAVQSSVDSQYVSSSRSMQEHDLRQVSKIYEIERENMAFALLGNTKAGIGAVVEVLNDAPVARPRVDIDATPHMRLPEVGATPIKAIEPPFGLKQNPAGDISIDIRTPPGMGELWVKKDLRFEKVDSFDKVQLAESEEALVLVHKSTLGDSASLGIGSTVQKGGIEHQVISIKDDNVLMNSHQAPPYRTKTPTDFSSFVDTLSQTKSPILKGIKGRHLDQDYEVVEELGKGASGTAFLIKVGDKQLVAKVIPASKSIGVHRELGYHSMFNGGQFPGYHGSYRTSNGDVVIFLDKLEPLNFTTVNRFDGKFVGSLIEGLDKMHRSKVGHFDLKRDNIMAHADGSAAIIDFGISRKIQDGILEKRLYSFETKPPEYDIALAKGYFGADNVVDMGDGRFNITGYDARSTDVYQAGVVLWELKFKKDNVGDFYERSTEDFIGETPALAMRNRLRPADSEIDRLIYSMLEPNPRNRPTFSQILAQLPSNF